MALIQTYIKKTESIAKTGNRKGIIRIYKTNIHICCCDICGKEFEQKEAITRQRRMGKIANGRDLCKECTQRKANELLAKNGAKALSLIPPDKRKENASKAGKIGGKNPNNKGRFTTERWNQKTEEEKFAQVKKASAALHNKLKDPVYAAQHYAKVFSQTKIGYQSKGHKDLHELIKELGFESHVQISMMQVDECNQDKKIVIEYNGDMWHCNPRIYKPDDYNSVIRMTAKEKWQKDIARKKTLRDLGYRVIVIWESEWIKNAKKYLDIIKEVCDEISK